MSGLVEFLRTRLDEDEQRARAGYYSDTHWERFTTEAHLHAWKAWREHFPREQWDVRANDAISEAARDGIRARITAHEEVRTTRVLAEIEAKRRILAYATRRVSCSDAHPREDMYHPDGHADMELLRLLALPFASHPDYREEWKP